MKAARSLSERSAFYKPEGFAALLIGFVAGSESNADHS